MNIQELQSSQTQPEINPRQQQPKVLSCSQGTIAENICLNSNCDKHVFLCDKKNCQCFKKHKGCIKSSIQSITQALEQKLISIKPLQNKINELINKAIDDLSKFANEIIDKAHQTMDYLGLTANERKFMKVIKKGENHTLTAKEMHDIYQSIDNNEIFVANMSTIEQNINKTWNAFQMSIDRTFSNIKKLLGMFSDKGGALPFGNSKVIVKYQEKNNLRDFFSKNIAQTILLYRASQNDFDVDKFFENCHDIDNTVVLCKTEYGKVIGGFTPIKWKKYDHQKLIQDHSNESFIFSVTNNDKFLIQPNCYAVKYSIGKGPNFGNSKGIDFGIGNKANTVRSSQANLNSAYINDKYVKSHPVSWQMFSGSRESCNFLVKEWQVWQVVFSS